MITLLGLKAQECSSLWLSCNNAEIGQQVLYSYTYKDLPQLSGASVVIATDGYFRLFVNGQLVSYPSYPFVRAPYREGVEKTKIISTVLDISRFLRNDKNTVSVLCSPIDPNSRTGFSLRFIGYTRSGKVQSFNADELWLCRPIEARISDYHSENINALKVANISELQGQKQIMAWLPVNMIYRNLFFETKASTYEYVNKVIKPLRSFIDKDKKGILYDFGSSFYGQLRVTIRDAKPGQKISIAGSNYICKGIWDEQFIAHFSSSWYRNVHISGDRNFRPNQVTVVEGLQIAPKTINFFAFL